MPYYVRILAERSDHVPIPRLRASLAKRSLPFEIILDEGSEDAWSQILLKQTAGGGIAVIERNDVFAGSLGEEEIGEFIEDVATERPSSAATWLKEYLPNVKVIYACQVLNAIDVEGGWDALGIIKDELQRLGGIFQADLEGFSNREGYHILWQFSDHVKGPWQMAVLDHHGKWVKFEMDLGNPDHRKAFLQGLVPDGVKRIK